MLITTNAQALEIKAKLFRGLSDPSRLAILEVLREGALSVGAIVEATGLSQSNTSNHLGCLHDCGLVAREQHGRFVIYRLRDDRVDALLADSDELLLDVARGVYECVRYSRSNEGEAMAGGND
ncbi:MAG: ArsR/SmtB family transcription factor [Longimicrobiales bacterium]|jgi:DNA-binding transcriptional ArsR family regulator